MNVLKISLRLLLLLAFVVAPGFAQADEFGQQQQQQAQQGCDVDGDGDCDCDTGCDCGPDCGSCIGGSCTPAQNGCDCGAGCNCGTGCDCGGSCKPKPTPSQNQNGGCSGGCCPHTLLD